LKDPLTKRSSRLSALLDFDRQRLQEINAQQAISFRGILGVDEVGRGSLIGPVVAGALIFPPDCSLADPILKDLDDSKAAHLNHPKRLKLADVLRQNCFWGIGEADREEVETLNIAQASLLASSRAIEHLKAQFPECSLETYAVIIDGRFRIPGLALYQFPQVKADALSAVVAGASVLAKAYRDAWVITLAQDYPGYGWESNAGYPTPGHKKALELLGLTPYHRRTYKTVKEAVTR
jgi:ribonuclease HII